MTNPSEHNRHDSASSIQQESDHDVSGTVALILDEQGHAYGKRENAYKRSANGVKKFWARIDHGERWMIFLTAIVALTTVSQAVQSCNNNKSTAVQVDRLIDAANRVDDAAESFSRSASGINGGVSDAVTKLQGQADKMDAARKSSEANAAHSLQATIDNFHQDQRAWLGVCNISPLQLEDGKPILAEIKLCNSGKTPASNVVERAKYRTMSVPLFAPTNDEVSEIPPTNSQSVPPQGYFFLKIGDVSPSVSASAPAYEREWMAAISSSYADLKSGKITIFYYGDIRYSDAFGKSHLTQFCVFLSDPKTKIMLYCPEYNEMN